MKKIFSTLILIILLFTSCSARNDKDQSEIIRLNKELEELKIKNSELSDQNLDLKNEINDYLKENKQSSTKNTADKDSKREKINLVEGNIHMYAQLVKSDDIVQKPSYGYIAELNPQALNIEQSIKIIESDSHFSKVQIEGYIPTWYLNNELVSGLSSVHFDKYIISETSLYLSPDEKDYIIRKIRPGRAAKIIYELDDCYYISLYYNADACDFQNGWIQKKDTGDIDDFDSKVSLDVELVKETEAYDAVYEVYYYSFDEIWGVVLKENENTYSIGFPGAYGLEVDKTQVRFIDN